MLNLFRKHPQIPSYGTLALDLHSHLLPGIDDGAKDVGHSLALIRRLQGMGFTRLFTTPHIMADMYPNTPEIIREKLTEVRAAMKEVGLNIPIGAAAEYLMDEAFGEKIKTGSLLTLPGNRVLVEMSFVSAPPNLGQHIFQLQTKGYKVLLAHPERYLFFRDNFKKYKELKDRGVEFQLNLLSLVGYYGKPTQDNAKALLKAGMIDYLGSDLHHERHADNLERLLADRKLNRLLGKYLPGMKNAEI
ncbi:tyrosine-protein phosphatase [Lewinella cohaerens]|uniref:tyrosine-protein phosphatase n=1 Tax=Lewinella cohaerens TaxID=70995 RepID=UPI00037A5E72|nr:CpsB/CapC family capsule biosynthesis tyrosine phosphatase [Lewinella cohaerens]